MKSLLITLILIFSTACSTLEDQRRAEYYNSMPAGFTEVITSRRLQKMKPIQIIRFLKKNCCDAVMIEATPITTWTEADIAEIKPMLGDKSFTAPVASTSGTISCRGPSYMSTVDREVQHLIRAYEQKTYPLAQCSTADFRINTKD